MRDPALEELLSRRGAVKRIAEACAISTAAVSQWKRVPRRHIATVAQAMGVEPGRVRPDIVPENAA
jgi:DNA-binding transcriptional regulator YdaS (Cro superfamily)